MLALVLSPVNKQFFMTFRQGSNICPNNHFLFESKIVNVFLFISFNITVKPVLSGQNLVFKADHHLMQVKRIAECSKRAFCSTFDVH